MSDELAQPAHPYRARVSLAIWLVACAMVLAFAYFNRQIPDTDILFAYLMLALAFPIGLVVAAIFAALSYLFGFSLAGGFATNLFLWVLFVVAGYIQWFRIAPWAIQRIRAA